MLDDIFGDDQLANYKIYETAQKVVKDFMDKEYKKIDYVASELGTTKGYLYASLDPKQTHKPLSIDRIIAITRLTKDNRIIEVIANEFNLMTINRYQKSNDIKDINNLVDKSNIENSDVFREIKNSIKDGVISKKEKQNILKEIEEAEKINIEVKNSILNIETKD